MASSIVTGRKKANAIAYGLLLFMGVAWGLALSTSKIASMAGGHPVGLALWQVVVSGSMLFIIGLVKFRPSIPRKNVIGFSLMCGVFGVAFPAIALFTCSLYLPAGILAIAFASMPLFTYFISVIFRIEKVEAIRFAGVLVGMVAMGLIVIPSSALPEAGQTPWVILALLASVSMSIENCYAGGMRPEGISSVQLSCGRQLGAVAILLPVAIFTGMAKAVFIPVFVPWDVLQWMATLTGILSGLAFTSLLYVIRTSGTIFATQCSYLITLCGIGWGIILFAEVHSYYVWGALVLVMIASALVRPKQPNLLELEAV